MQGQDSYEGMKSSHQQTSPSRSVKQRPSSRRQTVSGSQTSGSVVKSWTSSHITKHNDASCPQTGRSALLHRILTVLIGLRVLPFLFNVTLLCLSYISCCVALCYIFIMKIMQRTAQTHSLTHTHMKKKLK